MQYIFSLLLVVFSAPLLAFDVIEKQQSEYSRALFSLSQKQLKVIRYPSEVIYTLYEGEKQCVASSFF